MVLNILVVDDSSVMRMMIIKILHLSKLPLGELYEAANGAEALEVLKGACIDLALVDINMPVMDGEEMVNRLRENPETADLPVIIVSTDDSSAHKERLIQKKAGFVQKPFTPQTLRFAILRELGGQKAEAQTSQDGNLGLRRTREEALRAVTQ